MLQFLDNPTRYLFFTGKGGVGKTSLSCAASIALADSGKRVLLVSTDPASNLDEVLGVKLSSTPTPIAPAQGLWAANVDPEAAARDYRERMVGPYRGVLPDAAVISMEEQLSGACTVEIAAFDEFSKLLGDPDATAQFDHVVFDTAPTGHTLRLLQLPAAWSGFLESNTGGTSCLGPLAGLQAQRSLYAATLKTLTDPSATTLVLVTRPEESALAEADRTRAELSVLGVTSQHLVLNGIFKANDTDDAVALALEARGRSALDRFPEGLAQLPRTDHLQSLFSIVSEIAHPGCGVVMAMGKGGVGKTTIASTIAVELAMRGHCVHLTTTDPAAHLDLSLASNVSGLKVSRIDPVAETEAYRQEVMATAGRNLDADGLRLLEEDLRSPCTEEIAVFRAFARSVAEGKNSFVVLDTAPTGHTLLLLDATEAYHRQVLHALSDLPESIRYVLPRLRDPEFTKILLITLPEATPVHEAALLQKDLERAGITPFGWVINQSLTPLKVRDPVLLAKRESEAPYIDEIHEKYSSRVALLPWIQSSSSQLEWLRALMNGTSKGSR
ncbi:MAG: TRC40/GET3/ArsA family transport-energizing ATPase [Syntrophobacteraceae bacterium]